MTFDATQAQSLLLDRSIRNRVPPVTFQPIATEKPPLVVNVFHHVWFYADSNRRP